MANRFPIVFNTGAVGTSGLEEISQGDNLNLQGVSIVDAVNISATGTLQVNNIAASNITVNGNSLATVVFSGNYADLLNKPDLFSGDYNDLTNKPADIAVSWSEITGKPIIPENTSDLVNDSGFVTNATVAIQSSQVLGLATVAKTGNYGDLLNRPDFITREEIAGGSLTVEVSNTGDLQGSVFGQDSTILVDHINSDIPAENLSGTAIIDLIGNVTGNVTGNTTGYHIGDMTGSVFGNDSTVIVDSINNKIFAESILTSSISSTNNLLEVFSDEVTFLSTGNINANALANLNITTTNTATVLSANNTTISASVGQVSIIGSSINFTATVPATARGNQNDVQGNLAFDGSYIYYCTTDYTDGVSPIWVRQPWSDTSDWS